MAIEDRINQHCKSFRMLDEPYDDDIVDRIQISYRCMYNDFGRCLTNFNMECHGYEKLRGISTVNNKKYCRDVGDIYIGREINDWTPPDQAVIYSYSSLLDDLND